MISFILALIRRNPMIFASLVVGGIASYLPISKAYEYGKASGISAQKKEEKKNNAVIKKKIRRAYKKAERDSNWLNSDIMRELNAER